MIYIPISTTQCHWLENKFTASWATVEKIAPGRKASCLHPYLLGTLLCWQGLCHIVHGPRVGVNSGLRFSMRRDDPDFDSKRGERQLQISGLRWNGLVSRIRSISARMQLRRCIIWKRTSSDIELNRAGSSHQPHLHPDVQQYLTLVLNILLCRHVGRIMTTASINKTQPYRIS